MLSYLEFIKESNDVHYNSFFIKVLSRKSVEEAIEILRKDPMARSFRRENEWTIVDDQNKIIKVHLKDPELKSTILRKVKGNHKNLKYTFAGLGDPIDDIISTDKQKDQLKFLTKKHFVDKEDISDIFIGMFNLFNKENSWTKDYLPEWNDFIKAKYKECSDDNDGNVGLSPIVVLNKDPYNNQIVKKGFDLILKAIDDGNLDIDPNWIKSLNAVKTFNLF